MRYWADALLGRCVRGLTLRGHKRPRWERAIETMGR